MSGSNVPESSTPRCKRYERSAKCQCRQCGTKSGLLRFWSVLWLLFRLRQHSLLLPMFLHGQTVAGFLKNKIKHSHLLFSNSPLKTK